MNNNPRIPLWAVAGLLFALLLSGCTYPAAMVSVTPFSQSDSAAVDLQEPEIQDVFALIDSVLIRNGYVIERYDHRVMDNNRGWYVARSYIHSRPSAVATLYSDANKQPQAGKASGRGSVKISVAFEQSSRFFSGIQPQVLQVRDEIADQLVGRFGKEKVHVQERRIEFQLQ